MKKFLLFAISLVTVALGLAPAANAADPPDIGLNFDLAPASVPKDAVAIAIEKSPDSPSAEESAAKPLSLPKQAASAPLGSADQTKADQTKTVAELPPPPVQTELSQPPEQSAPADLPMPHVPSPVDQASAPRTASTPNSIGLQFESEDIATLPSTASLTASSLKEQAQTDAEPTPIQIAPTASDFHLSAELKALFHGDDNSLVARAVGSAEGTRTPDGGRTWAYQGHVDPGNKAWNRGTFSYQHQADSPEDADRKQLQRLLSQAQMLRQDAVAHGLQLSVEEELNGIDLANQSPRAALSRGGYIDRLQQARDMGLQGSDAVLWARTRAFLDPDTSRWNAPGLGNNVNSITADQERRRQAIERAIATKVSAPNESDTQIAAAPPPQPNLPEQTAALLPRREEKVDAEAIANQIISLDLPPT